MYAKYVADLVLLRLSVVQIVGSQSEMDDLSSSLSVES